MHGLSIGAKIDDLEWQWRRHGPYFALFHWIW